MAFDTTKLLYELEITWDRNSTQKDVKLLLKELLKVKRIKIKIKVIKGIASITFITADKGTILQKDSIENKLSPLKVKNLLIERISVQYVFPVVILITIVFFALLVLQILASIQIPIVLKIELAILFGLVLSVPAVRLTNYPYVIQEVLAVDSIDERKWKPLVLRAIEQNIKRLESAATQVTDTRLRFFLLVSAFEETAKLLIEKFVSSVDGARADKNIADLYKGVYLEHHWKYIAGLFLFRLSKFNNLDILKNTSEKKDIIKNAKKLDKLRDGYLTENILKNGFTLGEYTEKIKELEDILSLLLDILFNKKRKASSAIIKRKDKKEILLLIWDYIRESDNKH